MKYRTSAYDVDDFDTFFFEKNLQGDIVAIYNDNGVKIGSYIYDAWGNHTYSVTSSVTTLERGIVSTYNPFRYRGYYYDVETGWYYLQTRYYNPNWCRFISADGIIGSGGFAGFNLYAYCANMPVMLVDDKGTYPFISTTTVINDGSTADYYFTTDGTDLANMLAEYIQEQGRYYSGADGVVYISVETIDYYSEPDSHAKDIASTIISLILSLTPVDEVLTSIEALEPGITFITSICHEKYPIVPKDYDQCKVTETYYVIEKNNGVCVRTDYTIVSYYIWWDVRRNEEHWELRELQHFYFITEYIDQN